MADSARSDDRAPIGEALSDAPVMTGGWLGFVLVGAVFIAAGIAAIAAPYAANTAASTVFGGLLATGGAISVLHVLFQRDWPGFSWQLILGAAEIVGGIFIIVNPLKGAAAITLIIAIVLGTLALSQIGLAFRLRPAPGWTWLLGAAAVSFLIATALIMRFPFQFTEYPGAMAGLSLLFGGIAYVMIGLGRKRIMVPDAAPGLSQ
jgi:uncharacterized membrane protein HdeD (DUF308 family)